MLISDLADKKILILGFGSEGQDTFLFLRKQFPEKNIGIADKKEFDELPKEAQKLLNADLKVVLYFGDSYLKQLHAYDVIIKTPGLPSRIVNSALKKKQILTTQTNLFFENCAGNIIGVTGTKGKSTTASLIYEMLTAAKKNVFLVGNIEQPVLSFIPKTGKDDIFVYELSSAQLELATASPHIGVFLNFYPEHLDYHGTLSAYREAKKNITAFQTAEDYFVYNDQDDTIVKIAENTKATKIPFTPKKRKDAAFIASPEPVFEVGKIFNIPKDRIEKSIAKFKPLKHRLHNVGTYKGITFYNDSLATIPEATVAALDTLGSNVQTLIAGGFDRGLPMEKLAERIIQSKIKTLILFPSTGECIRKEIEKIAMPSGRQAKRNASLKIPQHYFVNSMATAVNLAFENTQKNHICLLSPAASSFNMFKNYRERGEEFEKFVKLHARHAKKKSS